MELGLFKSIKSNWTKTKPTGLGENSGSRLAAFRVLWSMKIVKGLAAPSSQ